MQRVNMGMGERGVARIVRSSIQTGSETVGTITYSWVCNGSNVVRFTTHR
jgi:hypothetical protein